MEFVQHCSCKIARCTPIHSIIIPLEIHYDLAESNEILYCLIPSNIGIAGKENEDHKAKDSLNLHPTNFPLPYSNGKPFINRHTLKSGKCYGITVLDSTISTSTTKCQTRRSRACSFAYWTHTDHTLISFKTRRKTVLLWM